MQDRHPRLMVLSNNYNYPLGFKWINSLAFELLVDPSRTEEKRDV